MMIQRELINPLLAIAALSALVLISQAQAQAQDTGWLRMEQPLSATVGDPATTGYRRVAQRRGLFQFGSRSEPVTTAPARRVAPRHGAPAGRTVARAPAAPRRAVRQVKRGVDPKYLPTIVAYPTSQGSGTIVIDAPNRYLYLVLGDGKAKRYGVGVGREGFGWKGTVNIARKAEWPGWTPPAEMRKRQPYLPDYMEGGPSNPLGARALYLHQNGRDTLYRIHGSNEPWTIGHAVSSGCIRMRNEDVTDLYERVGIGTKVVVL